MQLTVLLFGPYADAAGESRVVLPMPDATPPTAGDVLAALAAQRPKLRGMLDAASLAVNQEKVGAQHPVRSDDELAVIGMVSGG